MVCVVSGQVSSDAIDRMDTNVFEDVGLLVDGGAKHFGFVFFLQSIIMSDRYLWPWVHSYANLRDFVAHGLSPGERLQCGRSDVVDPSQFELSDGSALVSGDQFTVNLIVSQLKSQLNEGVGTELMLSYELLSELIELKNI